MNFQILESKLNTHSIEELEMQDPNTFGVIINKLLHIAINPSKSQRNAIQSIATKLSNMDSIGASNRVSGKHVVYSKTRKCWVAYRTINGIKKYIKGGKDKDKVIRYYINYCEQNNLKP
jgi:maleate cis-trans isomerase